MKKYTRFKLKAHDRGQDRHSKGSAFRGKAARLDQEHQNIRSTVGLGRAARVTARRIAKREDECY